MEVRLNSPHCKFKITNMADNQDSDLTPEGILSPSFIEEEIEKLIVAQLMFWFASVFIFTQHSNFTDNFITSRS